MNRIIWASAILCACAAAGWSQTYYEASGQTQVFTLASGAKVGPTAIKGSPINRSVMNNGISVVTSRGSIAITLPVLQRKVADIAFYDIKGRQMYHQRGFSGTQLHLETKVFAPGVYSMIVRVDGKRYARRIAVNGQGE